MAYIQYEKLSDLFMYSAKQLTLAADPHPVLSSVGVPPSVQLLFRKKSAFLSDPQHTLFPSATRLEASSHKEAADTEYAAYCL